ncbi:autotransporter outer membrane beta-barrel domain-containing protein [Bartonella rattimassiliensis]|uniref:Outer membrane autotransporter barrel domain-containing protein n=1 Tax=Bartonella rattimassiliensis 15908 TaxID=1094556 RepID=J0QHL7_9HYPH|nr:autotransporter outer membrane beta-barrel domain-containing protein [Bartonella rattimassiliensis]EJF84986.1 outer membrane autotransporter barrel domain-containing protein [Bartonella rattimassiliensis 15908]
MKKSFLLYTVSGVMFYSSSNLSYALHNTAPLSTIDLPSPRPTHTKNQLATARVFNSYGPKRNVNILPPLYQNASYRHPRSASSLTVLISSPPSNFTETFIIPPPPRTEIETSISTSTVPHQRQERENLRSNTNPTNSRTSTNTSERTSFPNLTIEDITSSSRQKSEISQESTHTSKAQMAENVQSPPNLTIQDIITHSSTTGMEVKSRRRSGAPSLTTDTSSEKMPSISAISLKPEPIQPSSNLLPTPEKPATELSPSPNESGLTSPELLRPTVEKPIPPQPSETEKPGTKPSASTRPESPKPTTEQPQTLKEPKLISLRPAAEQSTSSQLPKSVRPGAEQTESAQKISEKPVPPIKQPEKSAQIEAISSRVEVNNGKTVTLHNKKIQDNSFAIHAKGNNSKIHMIGGTVNAGFVALSVSNGGEIEATGITVKAETTGLVNIDGTITLKDSSVNVTGSYETDGIVFRNNPYHALRQRYTRNSERNIPPIQQQDMISKVMLENTKLFVEQGTGINLYGTGVNGEVSLTNSKIHADVLLKNIKNENAATNAIMLIANHSSLEGRVRTSKGNRTIFDLKEGTRWLLKVNKNAVNNDNDSNDHVRFSVDEESYSNLSALRLTDSIILFDKPREGHYQTLFIGPHLPQAGETAQKTAVYKATGATKVYVNTQWDKNSSIAEQKTDRIVINGDVLGQTVVYINLQEKNTKIIDSATVWGEDMASLPLETHGVSIIQVSGQANENSFQLAGNYMTIGNLPYKYVLTGYKPGTSHESQNLFGKNNNFWDFRLQNAYLDKDKKVRALLPQVANYLTLSNTLFSAGFSDVNNQNMLLNNMRTTVFGTEDKKKNGIFFSSYGEKATLSSNRDPLHYGYGADINYTALQLGIILATLEGKDISTHFGLLGTYGKLSFAPKGMQDSEKTTLDKWSLTAYSNIQHNNGLYANTLLSYGALKGYITTALVGNAAKLDGTEILNISATIGQKLATDTKGLVFEPQAQFIYQNLMFDTFSDANGLKIDMGNPHQWLVRIGGRLTKTVMAIEESKAVSFYGKMNVIRGFGDNKTIKIVDTFPLDPSGSSVEGGMGVNAYFSQRIVLNADISYRQKLQKAGISSTNLSGGIRYYF